MDIFTYMNIPLCISHIPPPTHVNEQSPSSICTSYAQVFVFTYAQVFAHTHTPSTDTPPYTYIPCSHTCISHMFTNTYNLTIVINASYYFFFSVHNVFQYINFIIYKPFTKCTINLTFFSLISFSFHLSQSKQRLNIFCISINYCFCFYYIYIYITIFLLYIFNLINML